MHVDGHAKVQAGVPLRAVEHEDGQSLRAGADRFGEVGQLDLEERDADAGREVEERAPRGGVDEATLSLILLKGAAKKVEFVSQMARLSMEYGLRLPPLL
jgi:hypothetical protein